MSSSPRPAPRVLVATVATGRNRALDELAKVATDEVRAAGFSFVRGVVVRAEPEFIQQLVSNVANDNEADAIVMVGGAGFGPRDATCDAIDAFVERRIEGFGEAYRRMLRKELGAGAGAMLARATAGVYNQCLVFALTGPVAHVRHALQTLVAPTLAAAVQLATGTTHSYE